MTYLGDFPTSAVVDFKWSTNNASGASITRATNGTISVYKANGTTQSTSGVTDTEDFDALTGIHHCRIDTSADGSFYAAGNEFAVVLSAATIDGQTVNAVLAHFSIQRAGAALALLKDGTYGLSALETIVDDLETRLTAARAGYLDNLSGGAVALASTLQTVDDLVDDLETRLSAARAGYLDNLSGGAVALASTLATVSAYVDELEARLTAARAGYLDNLSGGAVALASALATLATYVDTEVAAILAKVNTLPATPAAVGSAMTLAADAVNSASLAASAVAEIQSGLSTLTAGQVNAEVVDALSVDTYAEPSGVPAATSSLKDKINWLFMLARNKRLTTASADKVRNDADSGDVSTATLSDDGTTFTRGEYA